MEPESTTHSTSTSLSLAWIVGVPPTICIGMQSSLGRRFEPLFPSTAWLTAVELSRLTLAAACCQIVCSCCRHCWFCLVLLGQSLRRWVHDPEPKHPGCHHCWLPMESWEMACCCLSRAACWHWICFARIFCPTTSSLITLGRSAAPFTSSQVTLLGGFPVVASRTTAFLGGVPSSSIQHWTSSLISWKVLVGWCQPSTWYLFGAGDLPSSPETGLLGACPCPWPLLHPGAPPMLDVAWRHGRTHKLIHDPSVFF